LMSRRSILRTINKRSDHVEPMKVYKRKPRRHMESVIRWRQKKLSKTCIGRGHKFTGVVRICMDRSHKNTGVVQGGDQSRQHER